MRNPIAKTLNFKLIVGIMIGLLFASSMYLLFNREPSETSILNKAAAHLVLPKESPVIAEVTDRDKLQSSLKDIAEKGDYILIYAKAGKTIVYRPSADKIVDVIPLLYGNEPSPSLNVSVGILNGSGDDAKLEKFIMNLYEKYPNVRLISKQNAPRTFPTTIVYAEQLYDSLASQVAEGLKIQAGRNPEGVAASSARLTFIIGTDYE